jgi:non-specific protein-tyrosine kinase
VCARALADRGASVVIIELDSSSPQLSTVLALGNATSVKELVTTQRRPGARTTADESLDANWHGVTVIPYLAADVPPDPGDSAYLADDPRLHAWIDRLRSGFDWILIDCPPLLQASDAALLAPRVDAVLLVATGGRTRFDSFRQVAAELTETGANLTGVIFVDGRDQPKHYQRRRIYRRGRRYVVSH